MPKSVTPTGIADATGLEAVEALMRRLADPADVVGRMATEHLDGGGKRLRARLALASLTALGHPRERGTAWAAACELLHNGTLVHDDLQDGDERRRGRPTVWTAHGPAQAINVGDLMLVLPYLALEDAPVADDTRWLLSRALAVATAAVVRGQAAELALAREDHPSLAAYEASAAGKTSALFELPVLGAALQAGRPAAAASAMAAPFRRVGVLFQMQDDILDLYGDKGRGFAGSDLYEGKVSCLVVHHLAARPEDRASLLALLRAPRAATPATEVAAFIARFRESGALAATLARIDDLRAAALFDPALRGAPALATVARELIELVLAPIAEVRDRMG